MTLRQLLDQAARRFPERPAYHYRKKDGTWLGVRYCEFRDRLRAVSEIVGLLGTRPHSGAVALMLENSPDWLEIFAGIAYCGVTAVPIDPSLDGALAERIMRENGVSAVFADAGARGTLESILPNLPAVHAVVFANCDAPPAECAGRKTFDLAELHERLYLQSRISDAFARDNWPTEDDIAAVVHGRDAAGHFVGESLSHSSLCGMASAIGTEDLHIGSRDRFLVLAPLSNAFSLVANFVLPVANGSCIQFPDHTVQVGADIRFLMPTVLAGSAPLFEKLLAALRESAPSSTGALRAVGLGGFARKRALAAVGGHLRRLLCCGAECPRALADAFADFGIVVAQCVPATATGEASLDSLLAKTTFSNPPQSQQQDN